MGLSETVAKKVDWEVVHDPTRNGENYGDFYRRLFSRWQIISGCTSWPEGMVWRNRRTGETCVAMGAGRRQRIHFASGEVRFFKEKPRGRGVA